VLFDETLPIEGGIARRVGEYRTRIADLVAEALLAQLSPSSRLEVEALSVAMLGAAEALVRWWLRTEPLTASDTAELLIASVEPGLAARVEAYRKNSATGKWTSRRELVERRACGEPGAGGRGA